MRTEKRAPYDFNRVVKIDPQDNGKNLSPEKEQIARYDFIAPNPKFDPRDTYYSKQRYIRPLTVRVWMARGASASVVYATIWASTRDGKTCLAGHGSAGGYGYDKTSQAICEAFTSAGVTMQAHFGGCGESVAETAIESLANRLGWKTGQLMRS